MYQYLNEREMPPGWLEYADLAGHRWRQDRNGYLWLHLGQTAWQRADSPASREICGVPVPSGGTWRVTSSRHAQQILGTSGHWLGPTYVSGTGMAAGGSAYFAGSATVSGAALSAASETLVTPAPAAPNIPPDFAEIPLGPDCCRECHLDDGPLYDGRLCRYCWILDRQPKPVQVSAPACRERARAGRPLPPLTALASWIAVGVLVLWFLVVVYWVA